MGKKGRDRKEPGEDAWWLEPSVPRRVTDSGLRGSCETVMGVPQSCLGQGRGCWRVPCPQHLCKGLRAALESEVSRCTQCQPTKPVSAT